MPTYTSEYRPARWDIVAYQGMDIHQDIPVEVAGDPYDFTGKEAVMQIRKASTKPGVLGALIAEYTSADAEIVMVDDVITVPILGADTQEMSPCECYVYDIKITEGGVNPFYLIAGTIKVEMNVTPVV